MVAQYAVTPETVTPACRFLGALAAQPAGISNWPTVERTTRPNTGGRVGTQTLSRLVDVSCTVGA
jgi:hypothetical protein